jgi:hypothetical protein
VARTERSGHAHEIAAERAAAYSAVFTLGGDGTSMEVMDALAHTQIPIGILPGGTGNLVARAVGTPMRVDHAVRALVRGTTADIDLGSVDGRHFAFSTGIGVDARMVHETALTVKRRWRGGLCHGGHPRRDLRSPSGASRGRWRGSETEAIPCSWRTSALCSTTCCCSTRIAHDDGLPDLCVFLAVDCRWRALRGLASVEQEFLRRPGNALPSRTRDAHCLHATSALPG